MDEMTKQALNNATTIIKFVLNMKQPINDMTALANLDGLTAKQKVRIGNGYKSNQFEPV